ncbi:hypothetical protein ABZ342_12720 [Amycolatopsis sp. NPDC005961]|uniref:hypothetical protein n=1 Tax=Amycolatopsis sp. NPDC005961 TaxID=3156720 RepID=UPI003410D82C
MSKPADAMIDPGRLFAPGRDECALTIWRADACVKAVRIRRGASVLVGRGENLATERIETGRHHVTIPATEPWISRRHLLVHHTGRGVRLAVLEGVPNPGRIRYWGELDWRRVASGQAWEARDGLIAFRLTDRPDDWVITLTADLTEEDRERSSAEQTGPVTERATQNVIEVTPPQRDAIVAALIDAVRWPPPAGSSRIRGWTELPTGDAHRMAYKRLVGAADTDPDFPWQDRGRRGVDPVLLQLLIESEAITYASVQRAHPWRPGSPEGLIPARRAADTERGEQS